MAHWSDGGATERAAVDSTQPDRGGSLAGRTAVVTGGSSGIGFSIARLFAAKGARVVIGARDESRGTAAAEAIGAEFVRADVSDTGQGCRLIEEVVDRFGRVDILVNAAGIFDIGPSEDFSEERWDAVVSTKVKGAFFCTVAAIPSMREAGWGRVITVSANPKPYPGAAAYRAANAAIGALTTTWALEYGRSGITFNEIRPGVIDTPATKPITTNPAMLAHAVTGIPAGRVGTSDEVAAAAAYLASEDARYVQGASLVVDGGLSLGWAYAQ
jgi:NAD(P)-dependent dehydrogenase (short-subunit alcohol dehydrogenase family)